jgi:hypothetical protein
MFAKFSAVVEKTMDDPLREHSASGLPKCISRRVVTAKTRDEDRIMSRKAQRGEQQLRNPPIT